MSVPETCELYMRAGNFQVYVSALRTFGVYVCVFCWQWSVSGEAGLAWEHCCRSVSERGLLKVWWSVCVCVCICAGLGLFPPKGGRENGLSQPRLSAWNCRSYECVCVLCLSRGPMEGAIVDILKARARWTFSSETKRPSGRGKVCVCVCIHKYLYERLNTSWACVCVCVWLLEACVCLFNYSVILALSTFCLHSHSRTVKTSLFLGLHTHTHLVKQKHHWLFLCKNNYKLRVRDISLY